MFCGSSGVGWMYAMVCLTVTPALRIPMIFKLPGSEVQGKRLPGPLRTIDVLPTTLQILGLSARVRASEVQGTGAYTAFLGKSSLAEAASYAELFLPFYHFEWSPLLSMRRECETSKRTDIWGVFEGRVLSAILEDMPETNYEALIERFGFGSPSQAFNTLNTAKRMFKRHLSAVIAEYSRDDREVEEELRELKERLLRAG